MNSLQIHLDSIDENTSIAQGLARSTEALKGVAEQLDAATAAIKANTENVAASKAKLDALVASLTPPPPSA